MNRRKFMQIGGAALAVNLLSAKNIFADTPKSLVWEVESTTSDIFPDLFDALGGPGNFIQKELSQATVLIKPNICLPHGSAQATTTSPALVESLCDYLIAEGAKKIIIADHTLQQAKRFKNIELHRIADKHPGVKLLLANEQRFYEPIQVSGKVLKSTETLKLLKRADLFINLPTAKHHSATNVSLAIKNLMGLVWNRSVFHTQLDLDQAIADLALAIRPQLNIIDASRVMLSGGPTGPGQVITDNRYFASTDILAVDSVVAARYNFGGKSVSPEEIPHLWAAYQNGIGEIDTHKIILNAFKA